MGLFGLYALIISFLQFYVQAIVIDDFGAFGGLQWSVSVVRHHLVDTLVYSAIGGGFSALFGLFGALFSLFVTISTVTLPATVPLPTILQPLFAITNSLALVAGGFLLLVLVITLFGGLFGTYSVAFYRVIRQIAA